MSALSERVLKVVRMPAEMAERMNEMASRRGFGEQSYMFMAIERVLDEDEAADRQRRHERREALMAKRMLPGDAKPPKGLGLRRAASERQPAPIEPQPVIVNVGAAAGSGDEIAGFVPWIVAGRDYEREIRKRTVMEILRVSAPAEECQALAAKLDAAVEAAARAAAARPEPPAGVGSLLRRGAARIDLGLLG